MIRGENEPRLKWIRLCWVQVWSFQFPVNCFLNIPTNSYPVMILSQKTPAQVFQQIATALQDQQRTVSVALQHCIHCVLIVTHRTETHYFSSRAKSTVMNVHTCCCFLCLPRCCWNMNDWKAVQDIFHKTVFSPQTHSVKCHLCRRVTYGKVNAVLLCFFTHFYLEITFPPSGKKLSGEEIDFTLTLICTLWSWVSMLHSQRLKAWGECVFGCQRLVKCAGFNVVNLLCPQELFFFQNAALFASSIVDVHNWPSFLGSYAPSYAPSHPSSQVRCQCSALAHRKISRSWPIRTEWDRGNGGPLTSLKAKDNVA